MKNLKNISIFSVFVCILFTSCTNGNVDLNPSNVFNNPIGILDKSNDFQKLDRIDANKFIKSNMDFNNTKIEFQDFEIKELRDKNDEPSYYLISRSTDQSSSVSIKLIKDKNGNLLLSQDTCKCETSGCSESWGCNASGSGATCACSSCSSVCKKTSSSGEDEGLDP